MPRKVQEQRLDTRTARKALPQRAKPYFRVVRSGAYPIHVGYYRQAEGRPGTWSARRYLGAQRYESTTLGSADDDPRQPADGVAVLSFDQAVRAAVSWADTRVTAERAAIAAETSPTVGGAVREYIAMRVGRTERSGRDAELRLTHHVLSAPLADVALSDLTEAHLSRWREGLRRGGRGAKSGPATLAPATLARNLNDLRAALTAAARKVRLPAALLPTILEGLKAPSAPQRPREKQTLPDADVRRVIEAAFTVADDFGALVLVLAATGCRMDQAARLTVADLQANNRRIMIPVSGKGQGAKAQSHIAVPLPDDVLVRLRPLVAGRRGHERLLLRWHHEQEAGDKTIGKLPTWRRAERRPWRVAAEMARPWRAALVLAEMQGDLVPYSLRHSSIVRGLRAGLPVRLVAAVHDTSVAMIEKHYGAFIVDATEDLLRRAAVPLAPLSQ